jgi:hypothetical protein
MKIVTWDSNMCMIPFYVTPHYEQPKGSNAPEYSPAEFENLIS